MRPMETGPYQAGPPSCCMGRSVSRTTGRYAHLPLRGAAFGVSLENAFALWA